MFWPMAFPLQRCAACHQLVEWNDAAIVLADGNFAGVRHRKHADV